MSFARNGTHYRRLCAPLNPFMSVGFDLDDGLAFDWPEKSIVLIILDTQLFRHLSVKTFTSNWFEV